MPVRVKKTRQNKRLEPRSDSIGTEKALGGPAASLVADQMDRVAAGGLRIIERDVGFREQFGDPPAMRAADQSNADRGPHLEAKTIPEQRSAQHRDGLPQYMRDPGRVCRRVQDDGEFVAA